MRLRKTLTETLMLEEVAGEYETRHYDKTASAYMFGYACSSGFGGGGYKCGSSFGSALNFGFGGGGIARIIPDTPLAERFRLDLSHGAPHINYEVGLMTISRSRPLLTKHRKIKF